MSSIERTYWKRCTHEVVGLRYAASTRSGVVPGSPSGMSVHRRSQDALALTTEPDALFVGSLLAKSDKQRQYHAPALDVDFSLSQLWSRDGRSMLSMPNPATKSKKWNALLNTLIACGLMDPAEAVLHRRRPHTSRVAERKGEVEFRLLCESKVVPSSTSGHFHLYLEHELSWDRYGRLLMALRHAKVIGRDFCDMSLRSGQSFLLKPGLTKQQLGV